MLNRRYKDSTVRKKVIKKISDVRNGNSFEYYKERFYAPNIEAEDENIQKKILTDRRILSQVLDFFISFCPILKMKSPVAKKKKNLAKKERLVKKALKKIRWESLNSQIYDILETQGDVFLYVYFDSEADEDGDNIPTVSLLDSASMVDAIMSPNNSSVEAYIYEKADVVDTFDFETATLKSEEVDTYIYLFQKGKVTKISKNTKKKTENTTLVEDEEIDLKSINNKPSYLDILPIIHIYSDKRDNEKFSIIPAEDYVELCLELIQVQSDIRATNRQLGFPRFSLLDCSYVDGDGRIGGVRVAKSFESNEGGTRVGKIITHASATNVSAFEEEKRILDDLYNLVGVTNPTLMQRVGSSDSSKVLQQVNTRMEAKISKYIDNIIEGFKKYFTILFKENGVYESDYDLDYSFDFPRSVIKNSPYDNLLLDQLELNTGQSTVKDFLKRKGFTDEQIQEHFAEVNKEVTGSDLSVESSSKETLEGINTMNRLKNGKG